MFVLPIAAKIPLTVILIMAVFIVMRGLMFGRIVFGGEINNTLGETKVRCWSGVTALAVYLLSIGPVRWLLPSEGILGSFINFLYSPILLYWAGGWPGGEIIGTYILMWSQ